MFLLPGGVGARGVRATRDRGDDGVRSRTACLRTSPEKYPSSTHRVARTHVVPSSESAEARTRSTTELQGPASLTGFEPATTRSIVEVALACAPAQHVS
ncbi:hypothetical protein RHA1_ro02090 [Rhodococcus jostii RHA1]|uniref:Uncharacterized protein n=1 Tax=Rhodococcus jostii (strain RHA1) TaxID=101510 RepID=Q0SEY9_RHOJR|nr:hypothetical protein RHA1_ro02090 [Rhodococcus jostii RHA1]